MPRSRTSPKRQPSDLPDLGRFSPPLRRVIGRTLASFAPPPVLLVSEWSDRERVLSPEASAEPGRWDTARAPYLRDIMDAMNDATVTRIVVPKASQVGYSECLSNILGYLIDQDPGPVLIIQPSIEMAEAWSRDRFAPMLRDTPCLAGKVHDSGTLRQKTFVGGHVAVVGSNSAAGLASRPIRVVIADEVDRFPVSAGSEGDPLALAAKRQLTFWNRKTLLGSTPTLSDVSPIWREWLNSDQRKFFVPCPACGGAQPLVWANVRWDKTDGPNGRHHLPSTAHYVCEFCGVCWADAERHDAVSQGLWVATNSSGTTGVAGFHIPGFLSPWLSLADIVSEFLVSRKDPGLHQVWVNTVLGEPLTPQQETVEASSLLRRGEAYGPQSIPAAVQMLTAGVDVQADRLEVQIVGFGAGEEAWAVDYVVLPGDPTQSHVWSLLDQVLFATYHLDSGREMRIRASAIDTGGHHQHAVLMFCQKRRRANVLPIKGVAGPKPIWPHRHSRTKDNSHLWAVGVDTAKDAIYSRLRIAEPGPAYTHFPAGGPFDAEYFAQLTSEVVRTKYQHGRPYREWCKPPGKRNEALDTFVYCLCARHSTRIPVIPALPTQQASPPPPIEEEEGMPPLKEIELETGVPSQQPQPLSQQREKDPLEYSSHDHLHPQHLREGHNWVRDGGRFGGRGWWDRER